MITSRAVRLITVSLIAAAVTLPSSSISAQGSGTMITVPLQEFEGSGVTGTAVLTETTTGGTHVSMVLQAPALDGNHPTHIHTGTCDNFDPEPLYPLETINLSAVDRNGVSESDVEDVAIDTLWNGDYVILVHQSPEELTTYLVCGEIGSGVAGEGEVTVAAGGTGTVHHLPDIGVGSSILGDRSSLPLVIALSALAVLSLVGATVLRFSRG